MQLELSIEQGFAQGGDFSVVGFVVDGVADFSGFEHVRLLFLIAQD
jgi:hypothetical protein